ncbi:unnamed protein product [Arctia plantaginis]|uniref:Uncharacterized protein n=1 Tax=Arctia plantaginis TaxID=874455 RepID=A0A8S1ARG0_ARCPL|nr:unnamed protein product [Arctia plantaginis]CAB3249684.1 unnamed protein product [Arctia plantaginis]
MGRIDDVARIRAARPLCILHATVPPGANQVEHSMLVVGSGNGVDVESAAPTSTQSQTKHMKSRRPKTGRMRRNRVSPTPVINAGSPLQHWATAPLSRLSKLIRSSSASTASLHSQTSTDESDRLTHQRY